MKGQWENENNYEYIVPKYCYKNNIPTLKQIYEKDMDFDKRPYNYELEYFDGKGNIQIKIHFAQVYKKCKPIGLKQICHMYIENKILKESTKNDIV